MVKFTVSEAGVENQTFLMALAFEGMGSRITEDAIISYCLLTGSYQARQLSWFCFFLVLLPGLELSSLFACL